MPNSELVNSSTVITEKQASADGNSFELPSTCNFEKLFFDGTYSSLTMKVAHRTRSDLEMTDT